MGGHHLPNKGANDTWLTPPEIIRALGDFDLDPCAAPSPRPWPTATRHIELPEDGLAAVWVGRVWLNPPYGASDIVPWLEKMAETSSGISLVFARTETAAWQKFIWPYAKAVLFIGGRLHFHFPDGTRARFNSGAPSALIAYSEFDASVLRTCQIAGVVVVPEACEDEAFKV